MPAIFVWNDVGTFVTDTVPPGGSEFITFKAWAPGGGGLDGSAGGSVFFEDPGTYVVDVPPGSRNIIATALGKGGTGGHGGTFSGSPKGGGGGGQGGKATNNFGTSLAGSPVTIVIDASGNVDINSGTLVGNAGANGAGGSAGGAGGAGGTASGGTTFPGSNGANGTTTGGNGGGFDAGGGLDLDGTNGSANGNGGGGGGGDNGGGGGNGGTGGKALGQISWAGGGGGAGGSGAFAEVLVEVPSGENATIVMGNPGMSGAPAFDGDDVTVTVSGGIGLVLRAKGGKAGTYSAGGLGGDAASCIGDSAISGSSGGQGAGGGGGGGGSPGDVSAGTAGSSASGDTHGAGGVGGATGGAAGGNGGDAFNNGTVGSNPGGGGGGGGRDGGLGKNSGNPRVQMTWVPDPRWETSDCYCCDSQLWDNCHGTDQDWITFDALAVSQDVDGAGNPNWTFATGQWVPHENYTFTAADWPFSVLGPDITVDLAWIWDAMWTRPSGEQCRIKLGMFCDRRGEFNPFIPFQWIFMQDTAGPCAGEFQLNSIGYGPDVVGREFWPCNFSRDPAAGAPPDGSFAIFIEYHPVVPGPTPFAEGHNITILGLAPVCGSTLVTGGPAADGGRTLMDAGGASGGGTIIIDGGPA